MPLPEPQGEHKFAIDEKCYTFITFHQLDIQYYAVDPDTKWDKRTVCFVESTTKCKRSMQCLRNKLREKVKYAMDLAAKVREKYAVT